MAGGLIAVAGTFYRCCSRRNDPLSTEGSRRSGGRYNARECPALYTAGTAELAKAEYDSGMRKLGILRANIALEVRIAVDLELVLDLTDPEVRDALHDHEPGTGT